MKRREEKEMEREERTEVDERKQKDKTGKET